MAKCLQNKKICFMKVTTLYNVDDGLVALRSSINKKHCTTKSKNNDYEL